MAGTKFRRQYFTHISNRRISVKAAFLGLIGLFSSGCAMQQAEQNSEPAPVDNSKNHIAISMNALVDYCQHGQDGIFETLVFNREHLRQFIIDYCSTNSTTKQLKVITEMRQALQWPQDYTVWFNALTWHTENLRQQKITNYYSDNKAQQHEQQLLEVQRQLIELKQKLVDIEKQRLETELSNNRSF